MARRRQTEVREIATSRYEARLAEHGIRSQEPVDHLELLADPHSLGSRLPIRPVQVPQNPSGIREPIHHKVGQPRQAFRTYPSDVMRDQHRQRIDGITQSVAFFEARR